MSVILNYKTQKQILDEWCWAAVASSVALKYSPSSGPTQAFLASQLIDQSCSIVASSDPDAAPAVCHQDFDLQKALMRSKNWSHTFEGKLKFDTICQEIDAGRPVCCQIFWPAFERSHFITIFGYTGPKVVIGDPDKEAGVCSQDFSVFAEGYREGIWTRSYFTKPPQNSPIP
ncbi:C39 family peptidase [Mucilaginibacter gotjawali]|uniref:Uncharacterized protein n=2 Tax=Mucilaginibacter gotjawali TaxID=1550579 RepID=A0A0X8X942_9SPHI|nr:papain-like cysteine protease family protein [Mucilaginibacter gotjawali]MBB3058737.1 hypothetical protein [Mucilaginibacter gotjawali]BAU55659.1 hypothetical protein MgSA37_03850 [Mucilaginibacter gotjawali]